MEISYLFRTYNRNKYQILFDQNTTIDDAIEYFEDIEGEYRFKDVNIFPIENQHINYNVNKSSLLSSFNSRLFLLEARYTRESAKYEYNSKYDVDEIQFMPTPSPTQFFEKNTKENILLIQQIYKLLEVNPNIFNEVLNIAHNSNINHYSVLNQNKDKIKDLLKQINDESENKIQNNDFEFGNSNDDSISTS